MTVHESTSRRLLSRLAGAQRSARLPSVVATLVRDGEVCWTGVRGDATGGASAGPDLQYRIGSITKTLTTVRLLQLVRDGEVALDATVGDLLGPVGYADRSLRSLLGHVSGMQSEPVGPWWERSPGVSWEELTAANDGTLEAVPRGRQFHYSNLAFALLGRVAEVVSGEPWFDDLRAHVLAPLGMARTTYLPAAPAAQGFSVHPYAGTLHEEPATDTRAMAPAGQLWSTTGDLAAYARFLLEGHQEVLPLDDLLVASHPQSGDRHALLAAAHGLGFALARGGSGMLVGHSGSVPGFLAGLFVDRGRGTGGVVLANGTEGLATLDLVRDLLETLEEAEPTVGPTWVAEPEVPAELLDTLGVWHWGNAPFAFALEERRLVARSDGAVAYVFEVKDGRIVGVSGYHAGETLHVRRHADGTVSHLEVATFVYTREPAPHPSE
jgi:CubicO group peptidase (beta-lactamase class C family)